MRLIHQFELETASDHDVSGRSKIVPFCRNLERIWVKVKVDGFGGKWTVQNDRNWTVNESGRLKKRNDASNEYRRFQSTESERSSNAWQMFMNHGGPFLPLYPGTLPRDVLMCLDKYFIHNRTKFLRCENFHLA